MSENYVSSAGANDVLSGRGPVPARNEGNQRFRLLIRQHRHAYTSGNRQAKQKLAHDIIEEIHSRGGKFLKPVENPCGKDKLLVELDEQQGLTKVKQALRESRIGEWWENGSGNNSGEWEEKKRPAKKRLTCVRLESFAASKQNTSRERLQTSNTNTGTATRSAPATSPMITIIPPAVSPIQADSEYASPQSVVHPRMLLFRELPKSVDVVPAQSSSRISSIISPWDHPGTNTRKGNITSAHQCASEEATIDFLMQDRSLSPTISLESSSSPSGLSTSSMAMFGTKAIDISQKKRVKMNPSASEDDIAAFLLSSLSITDRPVITEKEEALERASLSITEKAEILSDALGLYPTVHHTKKARNKMDSKSTAFLIRLMKAEIERIPLDERNALVEAQNTRGMNEFTDESLEMFLLAAGMNTKLAARRVVNYWQGRKSVFGKTFTQPMTLSGAMRDDLVALRVGVYRLLPKKDAFGRPLVLLEVARHSLDGYTSESLLKASWYLFEVAAQEARDTAGVVQLVWFKGASLFDYDLKVYDKLAYFMSSCFPVKILASHLCCIPRIAALVVKPIIHSFMSKELRTRTLVHDVPESELLSILNNYGINEDMIPTEMGGSLILDKEEEWIASRRAEEMEEV